MLRIAREINKGKKDWAKFTNDKNDKIKEEEVKARLGWKRTHLKFDLRWASVMTKHFSQEFQSVVKK